MSLLPFTRCSQNESLLFKQFSLCYVYDNYLLVQFLCPLTDSHLMHARHQTEAGDNMVKGRVFTTQTRMISWLNMPLLADNHPLKVSAV